MFEKGKVYASGSNKSSDRVGVFQKGKVYEGGGGNLYDMSLLIDKTATNPTEVFRQSVQGNPIPHINPTKGIAQTEEQPNLLEKVYLDSAKKKQTTGGELNVPEIATMAKFGAEEVKNPKNISQAINFKRELDYKNLAEFEKAVQQAEDFNTVLTAQKTGDNTKKGFFEKFTDDYNTDEKTANAVKGDKDILSGSGIFKYLSANESRIYRYLIAKGDGKGAREYINAKTPVLETRKAVDVASGRKGFKGAVKNTADAFATGIQGGLTNMARMGVAGNIAAGKNMGVLNELLQPNYSEKLFSAIREQAGDKNKVYGLLLDVVNSLGAQIPQIAFGKATGIGLAPGSGVARSAYYLAMAQQIIGGDTTEAINEGYDGIRGVVYGIFDASLEMLTEQILGGIGSRIDGGETSKLVKAALGAVDKSVSNKTVANVLAKTIVKLSSMNAEGTEEFLQALVEPVMRNVIYGETNKYNSETFGEAVHAYIIGALCGAFFGMFDSNTQLVNTRLDIAGEFIKANSGVGSVLSLSEVVGNNSELYSQIKSEYEAGRDISNAELAALYMESEKKFVNPTEDTLKRFAERNVQAVIDEVNKRPNTDAAENADLQSTAKAEDHSEVLHEPDIKDISEKRDLYDTVNANMSGKAAKESTHYHIERLSTNIGLNVSWNEKVSRGKYIPSERRIVLNPNLKTSEMYNFVFKHEFTHSLETKKGYDGFKDYVFKNSSLFEQWARERLEKSGLDSKGSREEIIKRLTQAEFEAYKNSDELSKIMRDRFTMQNAEAEVLADFVGENLLGTGDRLDMTIAELERIKARNPGIIQRIRDFIRDMINRFKGNKKFGSLVNDLEYLNSRLEKVTRSKDKKISDNQTEKYSINNVEFSQSDCDKNIETISNMQSVANLTGNEFAKGEKSLVTQVNEFFEKYGNSVENNILGDVDITSRGVKDSMAHGLGRNKAIAFAAVPDVIRDGKIIDYQKNWKGRGYDTVILAAPISISGKAYYEGVIVTRNADTQRFYVHEVITEERTEMPFKTGNANLSAKPGGNSSPSVISLLDKIRNVKENSNIKRVSNWEMRTGLQLPVGSSLTNSNNSISNNDTSVNTNISENTQNDTEEHSIAALPVDELLNLYDKGEITREEYIAATDTHSKQLAMEYIKKWDKESESILQNQRKLDEVREEAVKTERAIQEQKKDRQSNINNIRRTVRKIDHALRANAHSKHIPEAYRKAATEFCKIFVDNDTPTFTHKELADIQAYYNELKGEGENPDAPQYNPYIADILSELTKNLDGKRLTELDNETLLKIDNTVNAFNRAVNHEAEVFLENKKVSYTVAGNAAIKEIKGVNAVFIDKAWNNKNMEKLRGFLYEGNMTPAYFMKRMGPTFEKVYNALVKGQERWARNMQSSKKFITGKMESYEYNKWKNKTVEFRTESGRSLTLSVNQAMQLVATAQREQSNNGQTSKHLWLGGVVIDTEAMKSALKENGKKNAEVNKILENLRSLAVQITFNDVKVVESLLTVQQKNYMRDIVDYLSTQCAAWGNEVTMELYGYRQFIETNYFPYISSDVFLAKDPARANNTILKSASFTKSLQKNASNPLMLSSFTDVALQHIESMCNYNAITVPLDTLNKVFNYQAKDADGKMISTVKAEIQRKFGGEAIKYMQNFITDLNTGIRGDQRDSVLNSLSSKFKKSAVLANLSVVLQQPSAIFRGLRDIDGKYYLKAAKYYSKNNYEECKQYAGVAVIKEMGRFDTGMGVKNTSWLSNESTFQEKLDDKLGAAAGKADEVAWSFLWSAVKAEIADTTDLKEGSNEFLTKAGERFTQLVNETQVYDSILVKSQNMRSKSLMGAITSFAAEPTLTVNMLVNSYIDFKEGRQGSGKKLARTVMSVLVADIVNSALQSLATAARDDDEDKSFTEKYLGDLVSNSLGNISIFAKIPYIRDLKSIYDGYDIERQDTAVFADLIEAIKATGSETKTPLEKTRKLAETAANIFGVPLKNVWRDAEAIARTLWNFAFDDITDESGNKKPVFHLGEETTADGIKVSMLEGISENNILKPWHIDHFDYSKSGEYNRMAKALKKGDEKTYQKSYDRLIKDGTEDSDIRARVLKQLKKDKSVKKQADGYLKELKKSDTFKSFSADDKKKLGKDITAALAKEKIVNAQEHKPTEYERLYKLFCTDKAGYKALKTEMLKSGKTEKQIRDGFEIAQYAYLQSIGIDLHKYLLYKMSVTEKYADTDNSGGVSKTEKKEALNNMDIDKKTQRQIRQYLLENNY
nr:MAG TPA: Large polyvalent protein-associated domain 3 [Caudoviricetes sp.]